jgi:hypothetical protein
MNRAVNLRRGMRSPRWRVAAVLAAGVAMLAAGWALAAEDPSLEGMTVPRYDAEGALLRPEGFRSWVFVGASLGLSYAEDAKQQQPGRIHNVYMQPEAYRYFEKTGQFPEKTMFALVLYEPKQKESINKHGYFSGDLKAVEYAVKDSERHPEGWAYYDFGPETKTQSKAFPKDRCYECHRQNGEVDNVFVQFYPVLRAAQARKQGR